MSEFKKLSAERKETLLMETAMRIMELFCDLCYIHELNPDKLDMYGELERLQLFSDWAREFEEKFYTDDDKAEYNNDWIELTERYFVGKINDEFGNQKDGD